MARVGRISTDDDALESLLLIRSPEVMGSVKRRRAYGSARNKELLFPFGNFYIQVKSQLHQVYPLIRYKTHIGLTLLLVFTGSLMISPAIAAHNLYQLSGDAEYEISWSSHCKAGHSVSSDAGMDEKPGRFHYSGLPDTEQSDDHKSVVVINNCSTSLHLMFTEPISLNPSSSGTVYTGIVSLPSSQLFVHGIADPPRTA